MLFILQQKYYLKLLMKYNKYNIDIYIKTKLDI